MYMFYLCVLCSTFGPNIPDVSDDSDEDDVGQEQEGVEPKESEEEVVTEALPILEPAKKKTLSTRKGVIAVVRKPLGVVNKLTQKQMAAQ